MTALSNRQWRYIHGILGGLLLAMTAFTIIEMSAWLKLLGQSMRQHAEVDSSHVLDHLNLFLVYGAAGVALLISVFVPKRIRVNHVLASVILVVHGIWHAFQLSQLLYVPSSWHFMYDIITVWLIPAILLLLWPRLPR